MNFKHGLSKIRLYHIWNTMIQRCKNPNRINYKNYGGRGISVCFEWRKDFMVFRKWALEHGYKHYLTIDRINNDGNYEPLNCRFIISAAQQRNSRHNRLIKIGKEIKLMCVWAEQTGINYQTLRWRINKGWPECRLLEPIKT